MAIRDELIEELMKGYEKPGFRLYSSVKRWNEPRATPIIGVATKLTLMGRSKWLVVLMLRGCWAFGKRRLARERTVC